MSQAQTHDIATMRTPATIHDNHVDVLIVGAGISGIGMAVHLQQKCAGKSFLLLERREAIGGTWNLFQYPGIRSDSDMHTLGYEFEPWTEQKAIADGPSIMNYLHRIKDKHGLEPHIRYGQKVLSASWSTRDARWRVVAECADGTRAEYSAGFVYMAAGYYDYDNPHEAQITGLENFSGDVLHPQFWPKDYDYSGKRVVVVGSGATAVTIVPVMAQQAAQVTMLQRTPTWYFVRDAKDRLGNFLRKLLGEERAYKLIRKKNVFMQDFAFKQARKKPEKTGEALLKPIRKDLGDKFDPKHFDVPYGPWIQRLCLVPDNDLFEAIKAEKAEIVTDHIAEVVSDGIVLQSGRKLDADIIVTATGLRLAVAGKVAIAIDGAPTSLNQHYYYKGCMFSNIPNFAVVFGYLNASWTLKADIVSNYVCRLLNHMDAVGSPIAMPALADPEAIESAELFDFTSGYIARGQHLLPRNSTAMPWRLTQDYRFERNVLNNDPVDDGVMRFYGPNSAAQDAAASPELIAAE
jgi:cation diffusion facilitator CzcD-associated flavoprotein CzcO